MDKPLQIGLTGGIGSGKSTVAALLARLGATVIDADAISRELTAAGGMAIAAISESFGADYITATGALDRNRMRTLVFADPACKRRLEAIIHPLIREQAYHQAQLAMNSPCVIFEVPLLVESTDWRSRVDQVLVVDCLEETQITRVMARSAMDRSMVLAIIASQASRQQRLMAADVVIFNEGLSLEALAVKVLQLAPSFGLSSRLYPVP